MSPDWHAERYAAAAELAKASGLLLDNLRAESLFNCSREHHLERLSKALAEYERTKNAP